MWWQALLFMLVGGFLVLVGLFFGIAAAGGSGARTNNDA